MSLPDCNAVFLSYASQDAEAASRICQALRAAKIEVWFDQDTLVGGDAWDAKIRGQIGRCALFIPVLSANTQARKEGYFRLEWKLAEDRSHLMAKGVPFIVPVSIDGTMERGALVPDAFTAVQWTRLPAGETTAAFVSRVQRLLGEPSAALESPRGPSPPRVNALGRKIGSLGWVAIGLVAAVSILGTFMLLRPAAGDLLAPKSAVESKPTSAGIPTPAGTVIAAPTPLADRSVAVLAFANMSADKDTEYFSDGISEEILDALANSPALRVAARTSSFSFKSKNATVEEIGRALHVAHVIEGSVRRAGNQVRITVQLINVADGYHAWSETYTREMTDIFAVQSEIAAKVAQKLLGDLSPPARSPAGDAPAQTKSLAAYDAYLRGRAAQAQGSSPILSDQAAHLYEEAVRLDPGYALAWARLAQVYVNLHETNPDLALAKKTRAAAATAIKLEPNLPEAHLALATVQTEIGRDFEAAQSELTQVERLRPSDAEVPTARASLEFARGNWGESFVALALLAAERDPQNVVSLAQLGRFLRYIGRFPEAERLFDRAWVGQSFPAPIRYKALTVLVRTGNVAAAIALLDTCPERLRNEYFYRDRADFIALRGDGAAAISAYEQCAVKVREEPPTFIRRDLESNALYLMGWQYARLGDRAHAEALYAEALVIAEKTAAEFPEEFIPHFAIAKILVRRGEKTAARAAADAAIRLALGTHDARQLATARQYQAEILAALGQTDEAISNLRTLHERGWAFGYTLRLALEWEALRGNPDFQRLMKEAETRAEPPSHPKN